MPRRPKSPPDPAARGRLGGRSRSPAKAAAVRRNGRLGGRPAKVTIGDRVRANEKAQKAYRGRVGEVVAEGPARSQFQVQFGRDVASMRSWWLDEA